jgi:hypothetical protein
VDRVRKEVRGEERRWRRVERKRWSVREDMVADLVGLGAEEVVLVGCR